MEAYLSQDSKHIWHPFTPSPSLGPRTVFSKAQGSYVFALDGRRYFDATSSWWCILHGHCHPRLVQALRQQASNLDQVLFAPHSHAPAIELAEQLVHRLGPGFNRVFFSDNGSTAIEAALKMTLQYWKLRAIERQRFLHLRYSYHGDTLGAMGVSDFKRFYRFIDEIPLKTVQSEAPYCYRCPWGLTHPSCSVRCLDEVLKDVDRHERDLAAVIVEPLVMGAGGMIVYPTEFLEGLTRGCRDRGIPVIFDEVFTGFGRTGPLFAFQNTSVRPDILCLSKGLTSGMLPLSATVVGEEFYQTFCGSSDRAFMHGHTFTANPISCAVALESLKIFDDDQVLHKNQVLEGVFKKVSDSFSSLPYVGNVRHRGLIWAIELVLDKRTKRPPRVPTEPGWRIASRLWEKGIWIRPLGNVVYLVPPYSTTPDELKWVLQTLEDEVAREECS